MKKTWKNKVGLMLAVVMFVAVMFTACASPEVADTSNHDAIFVNWHSGGNLDLTVFYADGSTRSGIFSPGEALEEFADDELVIHEIEAVLATERNVVFWVDETHVLVGVGDNEDDVLPIVEAIEAYHDNVAVLREIDRLLPNEAPAPVPLGISVRIDDAAVPQELLELAEQYGLTAATTFIRNNNPGDPESSTYYSLVLRCADWDKWVAFIHNLSSGEGYVTVRFDREATREIYRWQNEGYVTLAHRSWQISEAHVAELEALFAEFFGEKVSTI